MPRESRDATPTVSRDLRGARNAKSLVAPLTSDANPANIEVRVIFLLLSRLLLEKNFILFKVPSPKSDMANNNLKNRRFSIPRLVLSLQLQAKKCETQKKNWKHSSLDLNIRHPSSLIFKVDGCALANDLLEKSGCSKIDGDTLVKNTSVHQLLLIPNSISTETQPKLLIAELRFYP